MCLQALAGVVLKDPSKEKVDQLLAARSMTPAQSVIDKTVVDRIADVDFESDGEENPEEVLEELRNFETDVLALRTPTTKPQDRLTVKRVKGH
eukprot:1668842-Amphidinium_carterae.1